MAPSIGLAGWVDVRARGLRFDAMVTRYQCRTVVPKVSAWWWVDGAESEADAAQVFHDNHNIHPGFANEVPSLGYSTGVGSKARFARIEVALVEDDGQAKSEVLISRVFWSGIVRRGGVKPPPGPTLAEIAEQLQWEGAPEDLLTDEAWEGVESEEEARSRRRGNGLATTRCSIVQPGEAYFGEAYLA